MEGQISEYKIHTLCMLFPWMDAQTSEILKADMKKHGQRDTIKLFDGMILDGKNRMRACHELDIEPKTEELPEDTNLIAYVKAVGLCRRDLNSTLRILISEEIEKYRVSQLPEEEQKNIAELKKDPLKKKNIKRRENKRIAKEARTNKATVEKVLQIKERAKEDNEAKKVIEDLKENKITVSTGAKKVLGKAKKSSRTKDKGPTKDELKKRVVQYEYDIKRLENINSRLIDFIKSKDLWDEIKGEFDIVGDEESFEPTPKELRKAELK